MKRILLSGYYGFGNLGDEAILEATVQSFRQAQPDLEIAVLSAQPQATAQAYGVHAAHRARPGSVLRELRRCNLLLSGGGGLIQDSTSANSAVYYLGIMRLAQLLGRKTMVFAQGLGPVRLSRNVRLTRSAFRRAQAITVRDEASAEWLCSIGVTHPEPQVAADLAFLLKPAPPEEANEVLAQAGVRAHEGLLGISVRPWHEAPFHSLYEIRSAANDICRQLGLRPVFVPMHPAQDLPLAQTWAHALAAKAAILPADLRPSLALAVVARMSLLIGMRLHGLIFAAMAGVPLVGLSYDPKVDALLAELEEQPLGPLDRISADQIAAAALAAWQDRDARQARLKAHAAALKARAATSISVALACA